MPRRSDNDDSNNINNVPDGGGGRRRHGRHQLQTLEEMLDSESDSDSDNNSNTIDWASNWICRVNDGDDDVFRDRLDSNTMDDSTIRGLLISMITENQQQV